MTNSREQTQKAIDIIGCLPTNHRLRNNRERVFQWRGISPSWYVPQLTAAGIKVGVCMERQGSQWAFIEIDVPLKFTPTQYRKP